MTEHTDKLIADGLWRDISEAPRDNYDRLANALKVAVEAMWSIAKETEIAWGNEQHTEAATKAQEALAEIERIAKGEER